MKNRMLNVGVIGAGTIGEVHIGNLCNYVQSANISAIADVNENALLKVAGRYGINKIHKNYQELLQDSEIDAIVICSSTYTHAQIIQEAANAGKHVFCEKPIDFNLETIDKTLEVVKNQEIKLQIGFNRRFDENFRRIKKSIVDGEIGDPHLLHIISRDPEPPSIEYIKTSGGIFMDMTIHDFDMARYLITSEIVEISTTGGVLIDPEIGKAGDLDTVFIVLRYKNGAIGTIDNSEKAVYGYDQRVEVFGSKGAIQIGNNYPNSAIVSNNEKVYRDKPLYFFVERYENSYALEMQSFVDSVINDGVPEVTGEDGRAPVVMALAAKKSYDENRPVKLSEIG